MTMEEKACIILTKYQNDEVMLDAFFQWATAQFLGKRDYASKGGHAREKAYGYFLNNLRLRYGLSAADAASIGTRLEEECKALIEGSYEFDMKKEISTAFSGPFGDMLRKNVQVKVDKASVGARGLLAVYTWLGKFPEYKEYIMSSTAWEGPLEALFRVTLGTLSGSEVSSFATARDELISCGVINKSFYESNSGKTSYDEYLPGILVPQVNLTSVAPAVDGNSIGTYMQAIFTRQAFEQARVLEEVALQGVVTTYYPYGPTGEISAEVIPHRGLFAFIDTQRGKMGAVNPLAREILLKNILELKIERLKNPASIFETALDRFREQAWPESDLMGLSDKPDRKVWQLDQIRVPRLFIFIGNWLSASDLCTIRDLGGEPLRDSFIFVLTDQSLPSVEKVIGNSLKMWGKASIAVVNPTTNGMVSHQLQGAAHPSTSRILGVLEVQSSSPTEKPLAPDLSHPSEPKVVSSQPSTPSFPEPSPQPISKLAGELVLGDIVSKEELHTFIHQSGLTEDKRREVLASQSPLIYPMATATTHTAIFGTTGSGKSVTTKRLARELLGHGVPITIIDWHDEYVDLIRQVGGIIAVPPTSTTKPGANEVPFTWNVLDPRFYSPEVTPQIIEDYIEIVVDLLGHKDLMALTEPMKGGLGEALRLAYEKSPVPTFKDVLSLVGQVPIPPATADALQRRLQRFSGGSLGSIFCNETSFNPASMFSQAIDVRVKHLTADHQSAVGLLTFFLLRQAISHFKRKGEVNAETPVRHIIIIDEAPMVIGSNPKVEHEVIRMLQEVRKFGEGLILVCRNPSIDDDILRETNQKIAHKLDVGKDVTSVASMMGLDAEDKRLLHSLPRGVAFARIAGNPTVLVRING